MFFGFCKKIMSIISLYKMYYSNLFFSAISLTCFFTEVKTDYSKNFNDCKTKYSGYDEAFLKKECKEPLIYRLMSLEEQHEDVCLPVAELRHILAGDKINAVSKSGTRRQILILYLVSGLDKNNNMKSLGYGRHIKLTSPQSVLERYNLTQFHECGIDVDTNMNETYAIKKVNKIFYITGWLYFFAFFPFVHSKEYWYEEDKNINVIIYYDSKGFVWPNLKEPFRYAYDDAMQYTDHPTIQHVVQYVAPLHSIQRNYEGPGLTPPWSNRVDPGSRSVWCRGPRHLMAISDPVVRVIRGSLNNILLEPEGGRYCSVTIKPENTVIIQMFLEHISETMLKRALYDDESVVIKESKPYSVSVEMKLQGTRWIPVSTIIREAWIDSRKKCGCPSGMESAKLDAINFPYAGTQTYHSTGNLSVKVHKSDQYLEIRMISIEYRPNGVGSVFTESWTNGSQEVTTSSTVIPTSQDAEQSSPSTTETQHVTETTSQSIKPCDCATGEPTTPQETTPYNECDCPTSKPEVQVIPYKACAIRLGDDVGVLFVFLLISRVIC